MEKKVVIIKKKETDYLCLICGRMVIVKKGKAWILETDISIIHTWDYGHQHRRIFEIVADEQLPVEDSIDYE